MKAKKWKMGASARDANRNMGEVERGGIMGWAAWVLWVRGGRWGD